MIWCSVLNLNCDFQSISRIVPLSLLRLSWINFLFSTYKPEMCGTLDVRGFVSLKITLISHLAPEQRPSYYIFLPDSLDEGLER